MRHDSFTTKNTLLGDQSRGSLPLSVSSLRSTLCGTPSGPSSAETTRVSRSRRRRTTGPPRSRVGVRVGSFRGTRGRRLRMCRSSTWATKGPRKDEFVIPANVGHNGSVPLMKGVRKGTRFPSGTFWRLFYSWVRGPPVPVFFGSVVHGYSG